MADKTAADGRPNVRNGPVFMSGTRAWLPVMDISKNALGTWVLAIDRHMRAHGQDVIPCYVVWRPNAADDALQEEHRD